MIKKYFWLLLVLLIIFAGLGLYFYFTLNRSGLYITNRTRGMKLSIINTQEVDGYLKDWDMGSRFKRVTIVVTPKKQETEFYSLDGITSIASFSPKIDKNSFTIYLNFNSDYLKKEEVRVKNQMITTAIFNSIYITLHPAPEYNKLETQRELAGLANITLQNDPLFSLMIDN